MERRGLTAMLVTDLDSVSWLTGFSGTFGRCLVTLQEARFITDSRYALQAVEEVQNMPVAWFQAPVSSDDFLAEQVAALNATRVGFESDAITVDQWRTWEGKLGAELVPAPGIFAELRLPKFEWEIGRIRDACRISDAAFAHIRRLIQPGTTERDIAVELDFFMRKQGAAAAFPTIVVSGERTALPHGQPSDKPLEEGDFVTMDFGARYKRYNSDMTRTVVVGEPSARQREVYELVLEAQLEALHAMRPGVLARDVDKVARDILATADLAQYFGHGLGHGLGALVHDSGRMNATSDSVLAAGQVWTVEPGVYIPGFGGVRIEDDVVITEKGIEILNHSTKELLSLPAQ